MEIDGQTITQIRDELRKVRRERDTLAGQLEAVEAERDALGLDLERAETELKGVQADATARRRSLAE